MKFPFSKRTFLRIAISVFIGIFVYITLSPIFKIWQSSKSFHSLCDDWFCREMTADTLNMHYTLIRPENYGIYSYTPVLETITDIPEITPQSCLEQLEEISKDSLSDEDRHLYDSLEKSLQSRCRLAEFPYYAQPCALNGGLLTNLLILLSEYSFYRERDITDYLSLLSQTKAYLAALGEYEAKRDSLGLSEGCSLYSDAAGICHTLSVRAPEILEESFQSHLEELDLSLEKSEEYLRQNKFLLTHVLAPAYRDLGDRLEGMGKKTTSPLCTLPQGEDYYKVLFACKTGVYEQTDTVLTWLDEDIRSTLTEINDILAAYPDRSVLLKPEAASVQKFTNLQSLKLLEKAMYKNYPALKTSNPSVKQVWKGLESMTAPAFYLSTPMDKSDCNIIYVNGSSTNSAPELFTTLAHEGFPGHLYQDLYQNQTRDPHTAMAYQLLHYTGYSEGWALYSEFAAYDFLAVSNRKKGNAPASDRILLEKCYRKLQLAVFAKMDLEIHLGNKSLGDLMKEYSSLGFQAGGLTQIYRFILDNPCYYPSYYVGYLGLMDLKKAYIAAVCSDFTEKSFHTFFLKYGPSDYSSLKALLQYER